jgi:hypothetical protein
MVLREPTLKVGPMRMLTHRRLREHHLREMASCQQRRWAVLLGLIRSGTMIPLAGS